MPQGRSKTWNKLSKLRESLSLLKRHCRWTRFRRIVVKLAGDKNREAEGPRTRHWPGRTCTCGIL